MVLFVEKRHCPRDPGIVLRYDLYRICDFAHSLDTIPGVAPLSETQTLKHTETQKNHRNTTESRRPNPIALDRSPHHLSPPTPPHSPTHSAAHPQTDTFHPPPQSPHARPSIIKSHMNNTGHIITIHSISPRCRGPRGALSTIRSIVSWRGGVLSTIRSIDHTGTQAHIHTDTYCTGCQQRPCGGGVGRGGH